MKTTEEIKKGLECCEILTCPDKKCPYYAIDIPCYVQVQKDALAMIRQLEAENTELKKEKDRLELDITIREIQKDALIRSGEQLEKELDAAIHDCGMFPCQTCEEKDNGDLCPMCTLKGGYRSFHQWRGPCEENGGKPEPPKEEEE